MSETGARIGASAPRERATVLVDSANSDMGGLQ
jgi:hypothetical protein